MILTDSAHTCFRTLASVYPKTPFLCVAITAGGRSGSRQNFSLFPASEPDDTLFLEGSAGVLVNPVSSPLLHDAVLDERDSLAGSSFDLQTPDAAARCGCGASFTPA